MLLGREAWSRQENESSGGGGNGLNHIATTLQNGHSPIQSLLQHSVFNREGRQSQVTLKISILWKQQWEVAAFAFDECFNVFGVYSILDLDDKDGVTVEEQDIVFFLALSGGTNDIPEDRIKLLSDQHWILFEGVVKKILRQSYLGC